MSGTGPAALRRGVLVTGCLLAALALLPVVALPQAGPASAGVAGDVRAPDRRPNIVLILMDDFSTELIGTMSQADRMAATGASYQNAFVIDSLCCPSRAALLTGQTPHHTGVLTNTRGKRAKPLGGFAAFKANGNIAKQVAVSLRRSGYTTGFTGKFLNQYRVRKRKGKRVAPAPVPGWDMWRPVLKGGYNGWGFDSVRVTKAGRSKVVHHRKFPLTASKQKRDSTYSNNVIADDAIAFIRKNRGTGEPYFLEVATYGTHQQLKAAYRNSPAFPSAFADRAPDGDPTGGNCGLKRCAQLTLKDLKGYDDPRWDNAPTYLRRDGTTRRAPAWRTEPIRLTDRGALTRHRDRARMAQSIDRLVKRVLDEVGPDTYVFLTSDNGYHLGQHQLNAGKGTPYDSDVRVPLLVVGPGVAPGTRQQFVNNIDLAPTFEDLAGLDSPAYRSGQSFRASLVDPAAPGGRFAFIEHTYERSGVNDPDRPGGRRGERAIPSYIAVRSARGLLVRLDLDNSRKGTRHAWELYRYDVPWEDRNVFAQDHRTAWAQDLKRRIERYDGCRPAVCRKLTR